MIGVYVLRSKQKSVYYVGSTNNIDRRLEEHNAGKSTYTRNILPVELVFFQEFQSMAGARKAELWIKRQKSKKFIERIIEEGIITKEFK